MRLAIQFQDHKPPFKDKLMLLILGIVIFLLLVWAMARAEIIDLSIVAEIESHNNPLAISYKGAKYGRGLYQISEVALLDYNTWHKGAEMPLNSLYEPVEARKVAKWYIIRLNEILAKKGVPASIPLLLISWNWGPGNCVKWYKAGYHYNQLPYETREYLKKYHKLARQK